MHNFTSRISKMLVPCMLTRKKSLRSKIHDKVTTSSSLICDPRSDKRVRIDSILLNGKVCFNGPKLKSFRKIKMIHGLTIELAMSHSVVGGGAVEELVVLSLVVAPLMCFSTAKF
ncbi:hypothetical protein Tco_0741426 [Tanacetum coccineum]